MPETEEVWMRRFERERAARKQAEALLERKALELYESNQNLLAAYEDLEARVAARTEELSQTNAKLQEEIAERLRVEKSLRESEAQARTLALVASRTVNAVVITSSEGRIEWVNAGFERITGYRFEEVIGRSPGSFLQGAETDPQTIRYMKECIRQGRMFECDILNYGKSGNKYWIHIEAQPLFDQSGRLTNYMAIETDITERHEAEQILRESEERFRTLADSAPVLIWMSDAAGRLFYFNRTWLRFVGRNLEAETGDGWLDSVHPEDRERVAAKFRDAIRDRVSIRTEFRLRHADGEYRWVLDTGKPRITQDGKFEGFVGSAIDIHDLKRNAAILAERATLSALEAEIGYSVTQGGSLDGVLNRCAQAFVRHLESFCTEIWTTSGPNGELEPKARAGHRSASLDNSGFMELVRSQVGTIGSERKPILFRRGDIELAGNARGQNASSESMSVVGLPLVVENRLVGVLVTCSPKPFPASILDDLISVADAISVGIERKNTEQQLLTAKIEAEGSNRSKSEFLATMSHEVRTPLGAILGYNELLTDRSIDESERLEIHDRIRTNGQHLLQILNDILDLSKIEAGRLYLERLPFSPVTLVEETVAVLKVRGEEKDVRIELSVAGPVPDRIVTDPTRLRQILLNLLGNAIKFTPSGKHIRVLVEADRSKDRLRFVVEDEGIGMTKPQLDKLFRPFEQGDSSTTRRFGGTGLGLSITKRLADILGGSLSVSSEFGVGSQFAFELPLSRVIGSQWSIQAEPPKTGPSIRKARPQTETPNPSALPPADAKILLCEDNPDNQRVISFILKKAGWKIDLAENGQIALEMVRNRSYDLILMDMQMPSMDGYETTRELRARGIDLPIVAVTANAMSEDSGKCLDAGCDDYLSKPIDPATLVGMVRKLLSDRRQNPAASVSE